MVSCVAYKCGNTSDKKYYRKISFFRVPKDEKRRLVWIKAIGRENWSPSKHSYLCSDHFSEDQINRTYISGPRLRDDAIPNIFVLRQEFLGPIKDEKPEETTIEPCGSCPISSLEHEPVSKEKKQPQKNIQLSSSTLITPDPVSQEQKPLQKNIQSCNSTLLSSEPEEQKLLQKNIQFRFSTLISPGAVSKKRKVISLQSCSSSSISSLEHEPVSKKQKATTIQPCRSSSISTLEHEPVSMDDCERCSRCRSLEGEIASLKKTLAKKLLLIEKKNLTIKSLKQNNRRKHKKISNMTSVVETLHAKSLRTDHLERQLQKLPDIINELLCRDSRDAYSENIRSFASTLHFLSPKAFDFVRTTLNSWLPHPRTLNKWNPSAECKSELSEEIILDVEQITSSN